MSSDRKLVLFIAASLDGFIAAPGDDLSFLSLVERSGEDYGYAEFIAGVDTVIPGRKTYDWVVKHAGVYPHAGKKTYVITRSARPSSGTVNFYNGSLKELVLKLKKENGRNICCDGGAGIVHELLKLNLLDELIVSVIPVLLGGGTKLFGDGRPFRRLLLRSSRNYESGLVQMHYSIDSHRKTLNPPE